MAPDVTASLEEKSAALDAGAADLAIILAAGHGKRIKSSTSKMLHQIWGAPSVVRVAQACRGGLGPDREVVVVGIKAHEVAEEVARRERVAFAYQPTQNGTGDAVACALRAIGDAVTPENIYVFPGDMGLLSAEAVADFKAHFDASGADMLVMTGLFDGPGEDNYYGRILRAPATDADGADTGDDAGKVIEIKEFRDILALEGDYEVAFRGRPYRFSKQDLIDTREFNAGVYAFKGERLRSYIGALGTDNVQGEVYLTDLIAVFNREGLSVDAVSPSDGTVVLGFNDKSVLREMEDLARRRVYDRLKNIIAFESPDDFFIADDVVEDLERMDSENGHLDILIGAGVHIGQGVRLNVDVTVKRHADIRGNVILGRGVTVSEYAELSVYPHQTMVLGDNVEVLKGDHLRGDVRIGPGTRLESSVRITGSDEFPTRIGSNVLIKGTTYIFGSVIEDDVTIEHCVLKRKHVERIERRDGSVQAVRYYLPMPEGIDCVSVRRAGDRYEGVDDED